MMKRNSRSYSHVGTHALNYKRHRDAKASEAAESVEQPNSPFLCWIRILFCPIIFPLLMIYELIFLEDKDESADNNPNVTRKMNLKSVKWLDLRPSLLFLLLHLFPLC